MSALLSGVPCLVLGAGGFIGTNLCRALAAAGAVVQGFGHAPAFPGALPAMRWSTAGMDDLPALARALHGTEVVFHLLGGSVPAAAERDPVDDLRQNAAGAIEVFRLCREAGVRRIVFLSSGGTVYGIPRKLPLAEDHPTDPISVYGIHKLLAEKHLGLEAHRQGLEAVVLRAANPYGPFQRPDRGQGVVASLIARRQAGLPVEIWGDGRVVRDFLHVQDLAEAMLAAAGAAAPARVMNVGSGTGRSLLQVVRDVDAVLGLHDAPVLHRPARAADVPVNVLDITLIGRELGWAPRTDWLEGLRGTAAWLAGRQPAVAGA
ncbi:NAD-dependent epimerase/dehydratase family protein [Roseomonas haemaphysalidis]|uniref:NAD-dependent epimerase/dehydratase family protein n=1 Tax=Roseomonas haemaphysalidis TaxID=2768162 RepID=A0ABS3KMV4_9PROT|nr:NAD-dependent epimerase/dehydratase family protein [Roseomonas haemaphysalidis]MBO1078794.1 NAD-dependent epimerase/dehydratase family protein [Roseomonas haemaphysalidis]